MIQDKKVEIPEEIVKEIPYLKTLFSGRFPTECDEDGGVKSKLDADLLRVIIRYLAGKKIYILFACLPLKQDIFKLLEMFRFLAIEPLIDTNPVAIMKMLGGTPSSSLTSQNDLVKYGFALFYSRDQIIWEDNRELRNKIFKTMKHLFTSDNKGFKFRAKNHLRKIALNSVSTFTDKQRCKINDFQMYGGVDTSDGEYRADCIDYGSSVHPDGSSDSTDYIDG